MTIRLLRQFLQAGIEPLPALKTLNTAAMLRCQGGAGFTTIDLACLDRAEGVLTLYKYGAAPSYIKRQGTVARYRAQALPAGLESADGDVPPQRVAVSPGTWLVQVSDGVAGEDDEWLQDPVGRMGRHLAPGAGGGASPSVRSADGRRGRLRRAGAGRRGQGGPAPHLSDKNGGKFCPPRRITFCRRGDTMAVTNSARHG